MEIKIINEKENPMFSRKEVHLEIGAEFVPSQDEAKKIVAKKYSSSEDLVRIREVRGKFGVKLFDLVADIYSSKEEFDRIVNKTKQEIDSEKKVIEEALKLKKEEAEAKKAEEEAKKADEEAKKVESEKPVEESKEEVVAPEGVPSNEEVEGKEVVEDKVEKKEKTE